MSPSPRLLDSDMERLSSEAEFLLCGEGLVLLWEEEDGEEVDRERLVQMQLRDPGLEADWEKELVEVWEMETGSSLEALLSPV